MIARREFLASAAAATAGWVTRWATSSAAPVPNLPPADVTLRIGRAVCEVAKGHTIVTSAYNGRIPGPLIRLREGVPVTVDIFNDTDLPEWVHWHGLTIPADVDGTEEEGSLTVPARGHLRYSLTPGPAGARFVHTHAMACSDLTRGTYCGQFACVYIEPKSNPGRYDQEVFLVSHEWEPYFTTQEAEETAVLTDPIQRLREEQALRVEQDRPGAVPASREIGYRWCSINGHALGHGEPLRVKEGQRVLFHILNASATEHIKLAFPGHLFEVVALDGNPVPNPQTVDVLELGTAERVSAIVEMSTPGVWILGTPFDPDRAKGLGLVVEYAGRTGEPQWIAPTNLNWDYTRFGEPREVAPPDEVIPMVIDRIAPGADSVEHWAINGQTFSITDPPRVLRRGRRYRLAFANRSDEPHALHLHRMTFELTNVNGRPTAGVRKDGVLVKDFQTVAVDFTADLPGLALFHCHQQMHMECGFRMLFNVV